MSKTDDYLENLISAGIRTAWKQLNLEKNMAKGQFHTDLQKLMEGLVGEVNELQHEVNMYVEFKNANHSDDRVIQRIYEEVGDVINFACAIAMECESRRNKQVNSDR